MIKNFAHRGFSSQYPENTLFAFQKALEEGVDGIENDVQMTRDGELVILHDESLDRTTNGKGWLKDYTLAELRELTANGTFGDQFPAQRIPTLREYLELVKNEPVISNLELKTGVFEYPGIEQKTAGLLREYGLCDKVIISSFNHFTILRMQRIAPELKYGFLSGDWRIDAGAYTQRYGVQCYHPHFLSLTPAAVEELHAHGIEINPYTIDWPEHIRDMILKGVNSVITNCPDVVNRVRKAAEQG